jgi:hypothetical protein
MGTMMWTNLRIPSRSKERGLTVKANRFSGRSWILACLVFAITVLTPMRLRAQDNPAYQDHGFTLFEEFRGIESGQGQFAIVDTSLGYMFNNHIAIDVGEPVFFARATLPSVPHVWKIDAGDPYGDVRLSFDNPVLNYDTVATVTVPVRGTSVFSTGRVGLDWFNHFDHEFGRFSPFVNGGIANGILDTTQLSQPFRLVQNFKTLGFIADVEGGMTFRVAPHLRIGGSYYALLPAGDQKVYINGVQDLLLLPTGVGASDITHDRGYTGFARVTLSRFLYAEAAYVHSIPLNDDAATITFGVDVKSLLGRARAQAH